MFGTSRQAPHHATSVSTAYFVLEAAHLGRTMLISVDVFSRSRRPIDYFGQDLPQDFGEPFNAGLSGLDGNLIAPPASGSAPYEGRYFLRS